MLLTNVTMTVGEKLFEFSSVDDWHETVREKFTEHQVNWDVVTCVSASGHVCTTAQELYAADFPVKVYHNP
ncbi:hypothetical protein [Glaciimonas immobilis]|uniref:Uncharacterized protein n=1 Tax=Glaciimonas immobilis TaxID=728004 RepID=A0A840RPM6_9BURK|nr:hypothetical protein [Glaciimonas immobilis]KAF3999417.1 hypothetical protein HAV38_05715 [Glaciimonas immobilis]MBB5198918.1 hypothetical protein [Glaciimonas immobilis]